MQLLTVLSASAALFGATLAAPAPKGGGGGGGGGAAKTTVTKGGPASASVTIYPSYTCTDGNTVPPSDPSGVTVSVTEGQCVVTPINFGGAVTASLTAPPKTGAPGCYIQLYKDQGCGLTLSNQYHGFPFNGVAVKDFVGCANPPVQAYAALSITCG